MTTRLLRIGDDIVAVHAIVTEDGVTLIDAGLPGDLRTLRSALADEGLALDDIRGIVLTHGDIDHIGVAEQLRVSHGVPVHIHEADAALATGSGPAKSVKADAWRIGPALRFLWTGMRRGGFRPRHVSEVQVIADGDVLDLPGRPEIIAIPGHTPGSIAVRVPVVDALFLGDAITTRHVLTGENGALFGPFSMDAEETRQSLERLRRFPESRIFPGHGPEFRGTAAELLAALG